MYLQTNRYKTINKRVVDGKVYDSNFEAGYAQELALRKYAGEIDSFESHVRIPLEVNGYVVCDYYIDFKVYYPDGVVEYVETKGYAFPVWRLKWKLFEALFANKPNVRLLVVKQQNNFNLRKLKKTK